MQNVHNQPHSLAEAVADSTISAERAFCGLRPADVDRLMERHAKACVLVRLRSDRADGRVVFTIEELHAWQREQVPRRIEDRIWYWDEIRDVLAVAS
jgi:hypothetical protein